MANATEPAAEKAHVGDHVKLIGSHRFAGFTGIYVADRVFHYLGGDPIPVVKLRHCGTDVDAWVHDPKNQMRKL